MPHLFSSPARAVAAILAAISCFFAGVAPASAAEPPVPKGKPVLETFNYRGVRLDEGRLRLLFDEVRDDYLRIPNDDLLKGFRQRAGLPAPGADLGGWYGGDVFHVFGQIISGLSRMYAASGDPACRDKVNTLLAEWAKCIEADGYFFYSRKPNAPHYIYDKMLWGLIDAYLYCGNKEALSHLSRITDWAIKNLKRTRNVNDTATEWYTLSENLYRAYLATGDTKYRDFAEVWEYSDYWGFYANKSDPLGPRPSGERIKAYHAYSHVNTLGGAAAAYIVKGEPRYLDILKNAYDYLEANQMFATGGFGPDEQLLARPELIARLGTTHNTFETQCGSWAAFKMAKRLICFTGDAKYGDWVERLVFNGIGAGIHMNADGRVCYYADYNLSGGVKRNSDTGWTCCTGTRPQAVADLHDLSYFKDSGGLYVNLFTPS
ncbi:MAG: beta-L-arabinofuranosidase domain-containing protein, partial [Tepidisphaerales bacterium]